jgi:hypothetical protein
MMSTAPDRTAQFKADVADLKVREGQAGTDKRWATLGLVLLIAGVVLAIVAIFDDHGVDTSTVGAPFQQRDAIVFALTGVTSAVVGGVLFLRYSLGQFLRFWLARLIYEQQAQTDRIVNK